MKKLVLIPILLFSLIGCGSLNKEATCKRDTGKLKLNLVFEYNEKKQLQTFVITRRHMVDLDYLKSSEIEQYLKDNVSTHEQDGVNPDVKYDSKSRVATETIEIDVGKLEERDYSSFNIPKSRNVFEFVTGLEKFDYTCDSISK